MAELAPLISVQKPSHSKTVLINISVAALDGRLIVSPESFPLVFFVDSNRSVNEDVNIFIQMIIRKDSQRKRR